MRAPFWLRRLFGGKPRVLAECGVYGEPEKVARLYESEKFYRYE